MLWQLPGARAAAGPAGVAAPALGAAPAGAAPPRAGEPCPQHALHGTALSPTGPAPAQAQQLPHLAGVRGVAVAAPWQGGAGDARAALQAPTILAPVAGIRGIVTPSAAGHLAGHAGGGAFGQHPAGFAACSGWGGGPGVRARGCGERVTGRRRRRLRHECCRTACPAAGRHGGSGVRAARRVRLGGSAEAKSRSLWRCGAKERQLGSAARLTITRTCRRLRSSCSRGRSRWGMRPGRRACCRPGSPRSAGRRRCR